MSDKENFIGFKQTLIDNNERQYGEEIRVKHGDKVVTESNEKIKGDSLEVLSTV